MTGDRPSFENPEPGAGCVYPVLLVVGLMVAGSVAAFVLWLDRLLMGG